ncbi:15b327f4-61a9-4bc1-9b58-a2a70e485f06 [Thermothielavioides terrestris]|uniref:Uncharacterized protein n=2 Tax=Thermothielavioides terrestris TaxID=2587410 RepID=G2QVA3_THETT|nr:uncharacterized protein THITE_2085302 [Thermothielavioides terrestris NRRL 8126]AEO63790.1 hypothetical protein THITE_2085302 [Thermothielavioides terrestris NRRL 8126]SPQ23482.1 15b327f4-61a9-4bc1-9b58-a2a70e485f06 [Thermothielavioides terrestris]
MSAVLALFLAGLATFASADIHGVTPHDMYSSSVGVLGCKIDTNRVAYFPQSVDCDNICVRVSYNGRSVDLLRVDQSGGAYDISYDAWAWLQTGMSASADPITGGAVNMDVETVPADNCLQYLETGGLPLSAPNSMNYVASCLAQPNSWVAQHYQLFNIQDPVCHWGYDEQCTLNLAVSNQPSCPHALGSTNGRLPDTVFNIQYGTGQVVAAP